MATTRYDQYYDIPIWNEASGSPGPISGSTIFAWYDNDPHFIYDGPRVAKWCAARLGYPIVDIELTSGSFYAAFEEAVNEYSAIVNQFNIQENILNLQGAQLSTLPTTTTVYGDITDITQHEITPNLGRIITIAEQYGGEVGGGMVDYHTGSITLQSGSQIYDLNTWASSSVVGSGSTSVIEIKRIYHEATPAIIRYFDPYAGTAMATSNMMQGFGWGGMSPAINFLMQPLFGDILRVQAIEFNDQIRKSGYGFELANNKLKVFPQPTYDLTIWFDYVIKSERDNPLITGPNQDGSGVISDFTNIPYMQVEYKQLNQPGRQWIWQYTLSVAKEMLGHVRGKYSTIPIPNDTVTLDGADLKTQGATEKESLRDKLREMLLTTGRKAQMEMRQAEANSQMDIMAKAPLLIYIGVLLIGLFIL